MLPPVLVYQVKGLLQYNEMGQFPGVVPPKDPDSINRKTLLPSLFVLSQSIPQSALFTQCIRLLCNKEQEELKALVVLNLRLLGKQTTMPRDLLSPSLSSYKAAMATPSSQHTLFGSTSSGTPPQEHQCY